MGYTIYVNLNKIAQILCIAYGIHRQALHVCRAHIQYRVKFSLSLYVLCVCDDHMNVNHTGSCKTNGITKMTKTDKHQV